MSPTIPPAYTPEETKALTVLFEPDGVPQGLPRTVMGARVRERLEDKALSEPERGLLWAMLEVQLEDLTRVLH